MKIERLEIPGLAQYSYVLSADGKAVVIDPIRDIDRYTAYASEQNLQITHVLETHIHADFASGSTALCRATGCELALSAYDKGQLYRYEMPHRSLCSGDVIEVGSLRLQALYSPGHTPEHLSFLLFDTNRSSTEPVALFSGDFLFVGSLGRPDLLGEEAQQELAADLFRSLHERIGYLPDGVEVYPGHGAGSLCGSGMSDRAESTLGYERATTPLFKLDQEALVKETLASLPPTPHYYPRMKELNARGAAILSEIPGSRSLPVAEVASLAKESDVILLDLRRPEAFGGAHIPGSINIGAGQNLSLWAGWMLDPQKRIVRVGEEGDDEDSRRALVRVGLDNIVGFLAKGMLAWIEAGFQFERTPQFTLQEVHQRTLETVVLDVRSDAEWNAGHIAHAKHLMLGDLTRNLAVLPNDRPLITVCGSGYRSSIAASMLTGHGFVNVGSMDGGMNAWRNQKLPLSRD